MIPQFSKGQSELNTLYTTSQHKTFTKNLKTKYFKYNLVLNYAQLYLIKFYVQQRMHIECICYECIFIADPKIYWQEKSRGGDHWLFLYLDR